MATSFHKKGVSKMKTSAWILVASAAWTLASCEMDDLNVNDFLNDMTVDNNGDDPGQEGVCGDGKVDSGEDCDDGNLWDGDGCSSRCSIEQSGCYDEWGYYRSMGEEWMYDEYTYCYCAGYGEIDCWGDYYPTGCYDDWGYYRAPGEEWQVDDNETCYCRGGGAIECWGTDYAGCYGPDGDYHYPGEEWSPDENYTCYCGGYGAMECWNNPEADDGCEYYDQYYNNLETFYDETGTLCQCQGYGKVVCGSDLIIV
jgi:cysteine-rich repeat protein